MDYVKTVADDYKPWRRDISWQAIAIQAALAIVVGAYFLIAPDSANSTIRFLLAALLIVFSLLDIRTGFAAYGTISEQPNPAAPFLLVRGGAGVTLGILYFTVTRSSYMTESDARYVLGFGMIAFALVGLIALIMAALSGRFHWPSLLANVLFLLVGAVLVYNRRESVSTSSAVEYLGVAAIVGGLCLAIYGWYLRGSQLNAPPAPTAPIAETPLGGDAAAAGEPVADRDHASASAALDTGTDTPTQDHDVHER